ncbi:TIGR03862 family flavoprotein [Acinetobacter haemolyticus]|uniref:TIGR03862 family flavoprotein n=1 Tax=Acinetobacter haemolyticus TaxID=29430 RepID=A0AAJ2YST3_ACIHA|nr:MULTISPECIES: TIGR03862 family flavoprotein [Acinetobacter]EEH69814.1 putative flavoprotein, PP_4765 family [Acinetobacter sp. ATCC 27244]NAR17039.1 TIGR03862 family flavoprotein [Acinetobacter haemolyticus]NAR36886.1 TIGR03862 family flavoprotein [Acinetobacter haemolyticus]NAR47744.1 TIGR03862 family flavoprotein [Acinetobacter haemolyticus]NAR73875.1 TIGR03862 family flavoprotein [Acinetobacter haemolyticus]
MKSKRIAIIGAGPAGLMAAEVLSQYGYEVDVFEQKPSAARKFLMAGKTGLNISHAEPIKAFIQRYDRAEWLSPWITQWDAKWIQDWMKGLGIESYIGSSGRVFPIEMKAAPLLRAWLKRLAVDGVKFYYRHRCVGLSQNQLTIENQSQRFTATYDAIVLACGAVSWTQLGSDGAWQQWLSKDEITPFQASNVGVLKTWSPFMQDCLGQALKRVDAWVIPERKTHGDIVITHYGFESGVIYKLGRDLRSQLAQDQNLQLHLDLLPDISLDQLTKKLQGNKKQSLTNLWRKAGLDHVKINLIREVVEKNLWSDAHQMAEHIKGLIIPLSGFRPIEEAISCAGGIQQAALSPRLQLQSNPYVFCCGEMLDWDAPTGGYLLTACFATGRAVGEGIHHLLA